MSQGAPATYDAALALARSGRLAEAAALLQDLLTREADNAAGWSLMAALRQRLGQPEAALACHRQLVVLTPENADAHLAYGNVLAGLGYASDALAAFERAATLAPDLAFAHSNSANMLNKLDRPAEGLAAADRALALDAGLVHAWRHRGYALSCLGEMESAVTAYREALSRSEPAQQYDVLSDLAGVLAASGRYADALNALDRAIEQQPDGPVARLRRAELRLTTGDYPGGWEDYESRWRIPDMARGHREMTPELMGRLSRAPHRDDMAGQRVLVIGEQGVGDVIMFASVLPDLAAIAAQVTCIVDPRLVRLFTHSLPGIAFAPEGVAGRVDPAAFDRVVALGSLPYMFRRSAAAFPGRPYLSASPAVADGWRQRVAAMGPGLRVGLSWRGGVKRTRAVVRSMALADLATADGDDRLLVSLQYGDVAHEIAAVNGGRRRPIAAFDPAGIDDFEDLAGLVSALDMVVTVQTTLAHLTGALGRPGLVMIPRWPEWRYGLGGEQMAWYGSLRLLRQAQPGDWTPVLTEVDRALAALASNEKTPRGGGAS